MPRYRRWDDKLKDMLEEMRRWVENFKRYIIEDGQDLATLVREGRKMGIFTTDDSREISGMYNIFLIELDKPLEQIKKALEDFEESVYDFIRKVRARWK
jgi:tRNA/tmRNA/rRNA uracil-C5-methylase (TrmA/RlmC/RlmD family)